jgi:hypothetical protein
MNLFRGWIGEKKTSLYLWLSLSRESYHRFNNLILASRNGTVQIDHLIISAYGLFIVETKNKQGWIFGTEDQAKWTQSIYGHRYHFQNPLRQAFRHKKVISDILDVDESVIHTLIYFVGECTFKTKVPDNVIKSGVGQYIKQFTNQVLSPDEVIQTVTRLKWLLSEYSVSRKEHLKSLEERHSSDTICPKCGSELVERVVKSVSQPGKYFLGCSRFPTCRFTKNIT